jgi:hypothetical protein
MMEATKPNPLRARELVPLLMAVQPHCSEKIWLSGGTLRDILIGSAANETSDVDLLFFNEKEISRNYESDIEAELVELTHIRNLSVKNQARMGLVADGVKYKNLLQSVASFPDVTIAMAACVHDAKTRTALVFAPYGLPSRDQTFIQPTSRFLAAHQLGGYYAWLDRKKYEQRFRNWSIDTAGHEPTALTSAFAVLTD